MTAPVNAKREPPYKIAGAVLAIIAIVAMVLVYFQFRGDFLTRTQLTMMAARSGLSMDKGAKITYNGVEIGRVADVEEVNVGGEPKAKIILDVDPKYLHLIPQNVVADDQRHHGVRQQVRVVLVAAGSCGAAHRSCRRHRRHHGHHGVQHVIRDGGVAGRAGRSDQAEPDADRHRPGARRARRPVRRVDRQRQPDPAEINPQMPQIRRDNQLLADLADVYADAGAEPVRRPAERGDHRPHPQRPAGQHRPGVDGGRRVRQHRRRHLRDAAART